MSDLVYLVNDNSDDSAGHYPADVADVLLRTAEGWHRADPATGQPLADGQDAAEAPASPSLREQLTALTVKELHEFATANHIDSSHLRKEADIVELLLAALPPDTVVPPPAAGTNPDGDAAGVNTKE